MELYGQNNESAVSSIERSFVHSSLLRAFGVRLARRLEGASVPVELVQKLISGSNERLMRPAAYRYLKKVSLEALNYSEHIMPQAETGIKQTLKTDEFGPVELDLSQTVDSPLLTVRWSKDADVHEFMVHGEGDETFRMIERDVFSVRVSDFDSATETRERKYFWEDSDGQSRMVNSNEQTDRDSAPLNAHRAVLLGYSIEVAYNKLND